MGEGCTIALLVLIGLLLSSESLGFLLWALNRWALALIGPLIHLYTITIGSSHSIPAAVATMFTPGPAQVYWVGAEWMSNGSFWHPLSTMCAVLLVSLAIELVGRRVYASEIAAILGRQGRRSSAP
jgi:hypothetical protein